MSLGELSTVVRRGLGAEARQRKAARGSAIGRIADRRARLRRPRHLVADDSLTVERAGRESGARGGRRRPERTPLRLRIPPLLVFLAGSLSTDSG